MNQEIGERFAIYNGDCVEVMAGLPDASAHYSIYSPPFASLYTYSNSERDMGNAKSDAEFFEHYAFMARELYRVLKPGRLISFHCTNLPYMKERDGFIGLKDFRGQLIRLHQSLNLNGDGTYHPDENFIYHSEVCIWKDPVTAMQRTKAIGLLHKQLKKDSAMSRQGIADYLVTMRKPGTNDEPISHTDADFPVSLWQRYASPVWMDINPSKTLQYAAARDDNDERHICPLQLEVIERALALWSNEGDVVLSPFAGIGSEGHVSLKAGRRFVGVELKESYYEQAVRNLRAAEREAQTSTLFNLAPALNAAAPPLT
jgi:DNA modification methylase